MTSLKNQYEYLIMVLPPLTFGNSSPSLFFDNRTKEEKEESARINNTIMIQRTLSPLIEDLECVAKEGSFIELEDKFIGVVKEELKKLEDKYPVNKLTILRPEYYLLLKVLCLWKEGTLDSLLKAIGFLNDINTAEKPVIKKLLWSEVAQNVYAITENDPLLQDPKMKKALFQLLLSGLKNQSGEPEISLIIADVLLQLQAYNEKHGIIDVQKVGRELVFLDCGDIYTLVNETLESLENDKEANPYEVNLLHLLKNRFLTFANTQKPIQGYQLEAIQALQQSPAFASAFRKKYSDKTYFAILEYCLAEQIDTFLFNFKENIAPITEEVLNFFKRSFGSIQSPSVLINEIRDFLKKTHESAHSEIDLRGNEATIKMLIAAFNSRVKDDSTKLFLTVLSKSFEGQIF